MDLALIVRFVAGFVLLVGGAEYLVRGASRLAILLGVSPLVVGLTVVAYGTSAPEIAVAAQASLAGKSDLVVGNVVGSNICNVLLVLGLAAMVTPLSVDRRVIRFEVPLVVAVSFAVFAMAVQGGGIGRAESGVLLLGAIVYTTYVGLAGRAERDPDTDALPGGGGPTARGVLTQVAWLVLGLGGLVVGSRWLVEGATAVARSLGMSELVIGLTIVAIGTSLPEVATSVVAVLKGERDLAIGNVLGSNLLNLLAVFGVAGALAPGGVPVSEAATGFDMPLMIAVAVVCLPVFFTGQRIARWEGVTLFAYYLVYLAFVVVNATRADALPSWMAPALVFGVPALVIALSVLPGVWRRVAR